MRNLRVNIYLATQEGANAPEGPGWYVVARNMESTEAIPDEIIPTVRIPGAIMEKLAQVIDNFTSARPQNWNQSYNRFDMSLREAVREANDDAKDAVQAQIAYLERMAGTLDTLKQRVSEFDSAE